MPPLILHNVPDDELYVGEDGIQRPYAMLFPGIETSPSLLRNRRAVPESGSFGKSTRRSRSRTGTPAAKKEDPTLAAADSIFSSFLTSRAAAPSEPQQKQSLPSSASQPDLYAPGLLAAIDGNGSTPVRYVHKEPTEVILRGFKDSHQYAAIREFEAIGGRICEDYPRDPPGDQRRFKGDLRDQATLRTQPMTLEEKVKALRFAGGEHWIKVTFESAEGAEAALEASPQTVLGYFVFAELYRGVPPTADEAITAGRPGQTTGATSGRKGVFGSPRKQSRTSNNLPRSYTSPAMVQTNRHSQNSPESTASSRTIDTATISTATVTENVEQNLAPNTEDNATEEYCRKIPTARRVQLLPAEQALLPQKSYSKRVMAQIPFLSWFSGDMIGGQVPRTNEGNFDYAKASFYWIVIFWLDWIFGGIFEIAAPSKDE